MPGPSLAVEDFLEALTAQLDRTQDSLRLKAVNRPLTFALKDFNVDLKVFVEMDEHSQIRLRPAGPNEANASTVTIGFTTITRPMIEENTISLGMTQAPTLEEAGLDPQERTRLERLGVRNTAQLEQLERTAGDDTLSRLSGVDIGRLREALQMGRPQIDGAEIEPRRTTGRLARAPERRADAALPEREPRAPRPRVEPIPVLPVAPGADRIVLRGRNLIRNGQSPEARLDGRRLRLADVRDERMTVELPVGHRSGVLTLNLPDGEVVELDLIEQDAPDPWLPDDSARPGRGKGGT